jgi:hypothetical protein
LTPIVLLSLVVEWLSLTLTLSGTAQGVPLTTGKSPLKTRNKAKHTLPNHAGYGPCRRDLSDPPRRPSLERGPSRSRRCASLERAPPHSRGRSPSSRPRLDRGSVPPSTRLRLARGRPARVRRPRTQAFNALTPAGRRHHVHGVRAPVLPHQVPRREPIPITVGRDCAAGPAPVP